MKFLMNNLMAFMTVGKTISMSVIYKRIIQIAIISLALTIITSILMGTIIIGIIYMIYLAMINYGIATDTAIFITIASAISIMTFFVLATISYIKSLITVSKALENEKSPVISHAAGVANAFVDGLMGRDHK